MSKSQMTKVPSYDRHMAIRQRKADEPNDDNDVPKLKKGPIVDTAAMVSVVNKRDHTSLQRVVPMRVPMTIKAAVGTTTVTEQGALQVGTIQLNKVVIFHSVTLQERARAAEEVFSDEDACYSAIFRGIQQATAGAV